MLDEYNTQAGRSMREEPYIAWVQTLLFNLHGFFITEVEC